MIASSALVMLVSLVIPRTEPTTDHVPVSPVALAAPFDPGTAVTNDILAHAHGQGGLNRATAMSRQAADERSRADLQTFGMIGRTQMDVWWGTTGASLIAASVRSAGPPS